MDQKETPHLYIFERHTLPAPWRIIAPLVIPLLLVPGVAQSAPHHTMAPDEAELPADFRMHVVLTKPGGAIRLAPAVVVPLVNAGAHDIALEHPALGPPVLRVWTDGQLVRGPEAIPALTAPTAGIFTDSNLDFGGDITAMVRFSTKSDGTLLAKCSATDNWSPDAKAFFIQEGKLVYDIGGLGRMGGGRKVDDGLPHQAMWIVRDNQARILLDGKTVAQKTGFRRPDVTGHVLKVGTAARDFGGDLSMGRIHEVRGWNRALTEAEIAQAFDNPTAVATNAPDFLYQAPVAKIRPVIEPAPGATVGESWVQPLERSDHGALVRGWNASTLRMGGQIYSSLCVTCHGTKEQPGSLPTALNFSTGTFKNGADPFSMYLTLTKGFGQMVAQPQYTTAQHYAVIQYIRETFLRPHNPGQLAEITPAYLESLPKGLAVAPAEQNKSSVPFYELMDFGPTMFWTFEVEKKNIAQKGIAIRLDQGSGGVSKGRAWMFYDHDTMRVAAATSGSFIDWKNIAFDGTHGTHIRLTGKRHFVNPPGPGWASPDGGWDDPRPLDRDGNPYGPLPRTWAHYEGTYLHEGKTVIASRISGTRVLESPGWIESSSEPIFTRTLNLEVAAKPLQLRVAPDSVNVALVGDGSLRREDGFWIASLPGGAKALLLVSGDDALSALAAKLPAPASLNPLTHGGAPRWPDAVLTTSIAGPEAEGFIADTFPLPVDNPWSSSMRPGGFDFTPDGKAAVVATWNGDVWRVDGVMSAAPAPLKWRRIATGLFQPLGVKFRNGELFVLCRDQLARLDDLNGDGEIDLIANFNNDHQVTESFHEFAMGLQTDAAGNFYYAKSARHGLEALVPHHGTLLRVSADGSHTNIIATGLRAANGICVNDDGSFFVTDQEGNWTPKNRINRITPGKFYGNMFGYSDVTDSSDAAMEQPMVWITNRKDRSPAEVLRVPAEHWGNLGGSLLHLSYGTGQAYLIPHEQVDGIWQGAVCELPLPAFGSGIMRGRFAADGALYTCGMFAWAGMATEPGGFYRIRRGQAAANLPLRVHVSKDTLRIVFSDPLDAASVRSDSAKYTSWSLVRSASYGSAHHDVKNRVVESARLDNDGRTLILGIPGLAPTACYELLLQLRDAGGRDFKRSLHGTIHRLAP